VPNENVLHALYLLPVLSDVAFVQDNGTLGETNCHHGQVFMNTEFSDLMTVEALKFSMQQPPRTSAQKQQQRTLLRRSRLEQRFSTFFQ